jgi:small subunit ribosomal protein S4
MSRYTGPKCRLCRREGTKLYLKGAKCEGDKCTITKRAQAPGQHGTSRKALSEYGRQLREKQKAKRVYGLLEKQFKNYVNASLKTKGVTAEILYQKLESRLDNLVYRSGFATSRAQAREFVRRGLFEVNGRIVISPAQQLRVGDTIKPINFEKIQPKEGFVLPEWLNVNVKEKSVKVAEMPKLDGLQEKFNLQSIIESYSR